MVIFKMLVLISTSVHSTPLVKLITIPKVSNPVAALVSIVSNWTINSIWTVEIISIILKMIYIKPIVTSSIKTISSIPFILILSRTDVGVFILRLMVWIYNWYPPYVLSPSYLNPGTVKSTLMLFALTLFIQGYLLVMVMLPHFYFWEAISLLFHCIYV